MVGKLVEFFRDPRNQHLATWVQTMAVVFGVAIALFQLSSILEESDYKKGEAILKFESEFASRISREMGLIYEYYVNRETLTDESFNKLYPRDRFIEARNSVQEYISRLSACGAHDVCPDSNVDATVCSFSKSMYEDLSREVSWPEEWKIRFKEPIFYEMKINEHCGIWDRFKFWYLR